MRLWYARRGIPWDPFLACLASALLLAAVVHGWPRWAGLMLPGAMAACAASVGFVLDEPAAAAAAVTPRGGRWAAATRVGVALAPVLVWLLVVTGAPSSLELDESAWITAGLAAQVAALVSAWSAVRRGATTPGSSVAAAIAGIVLAPFVIGPMLGWHGL